MITHIEWHKTSEELPKQSCYKVGVNANDLDNWDYFGD